MFNTMKTLLIFLLFISITYNSISQTGGALLPSPSIELPPDSRPNVPVPEPTFTDIDKQLRPSEEEAKNQLRISAAKLQDPASLIEPKRWDNPLNSDEFDKIQNCPNYEKYGFYARNDKRANSNNAF